MNQHSVVSSPLPAMEFTGRHVWYGENFSQNNSWIVELDAPSRKLIHLLGDENVYSEVYEKELTNLLKPIREEVETGRGFVLLKGLGIEGFEKDRKLAIFKRLADHFGIPIMQNLHGDTFVAVQDEGYSKTDYNSQQGRGSKSSHALKYHTDGSPGFFGLTPDIVVQSCSQPATSGGESAIVSAYTLHNHLLRESRSLLERLYKPFHWDRRAELRPEDSPTLVAPVFTFQNGRLLTRHCRFYNVKAHEVMDLPLSESDDEALKQLDLLAARDSYELRFRLEEGDTLIFNNQFVLHRRDAFSNSADSSRCLYRFSLRFFSPEPSWSTFISQEFSAER